MRRGIQSPLGGFPSPFGQRATAAAAFTPAALTNLGAWSDASVTASITTSGTNVTAWADQSGNGRDLLNGSGTARPQYPGPTLNGIATLDFNGDFLEATGFSIPQPYSYALVVRITNNGFGRAAIGTGSGGSRSQVGQFNEAAPARFATNCGTERAISATTNDGSSWYILLGTNNGASSYGGVNAVPSLLAASPGTNGLAGIKFGEGTAGFQPLVGQIAEAFIWGNAFDSAEFTDALSYLQSKWAL